MSSTESSGAPAEATATTPAPDAAFPTFGSTRGSGLARGKRPATGPAASSAATTEYTPTAIEVVNAPREYQNPFAPAETPEAAPAPVAAPAAAAPAPIREYSAPVADEPVTPVRQEEPVQNDEPAELNILEPEQPKNAPAQTWESEGFRPAREARTDRPRREESRREERPARAPREEREALTEIPEKFLYVRPGHTYVPTPSNFGGAPRSRNRGDAAPARNDQAAAAPASTGGFLGWLKSLFGGSPAEPVTAAAPKGEHRREGGQRRQRGGRNRSGGEGGGQRRQRGGRGRSRSGGEGTST